MSTQLIQVVQFLNVNPSTQVTLPHNLNVNGRGVIPDIALRDNGVFSIDNVTASEITVTNTDASNQQTLNVWLQFMHTTQRWFGAQQTTALTPNPFVPAAGEAIPSNLHVGSLQVDSGGIFGDDVIVGNTKPMGAFGTIVIFEGGQLLFAQVMAGSGDPTGVVNAPQGSLFLRLDGGAGTTLYVKEGPANGDWAAK